MDGKELRRALKDRAYVFGTALEGYGQPRWPRYFSQASLDFVFMDTEHTPNNRETVAWATQVYAALDIAPLIRIPEASPIAAAMMLDLGAHGVVVPYVETLTQAKEMVGAVKYRPLKGQALKRAMDKRVFPNEETREYLNHHNENTVIWIMVESIAGIENLEGILSIGDIDGVLIGPHDLSVSIGVPEQYDHPVFKECVDGIIQICNQKDVSAGMHVSWGDVDDEFQLLQKGCNIVMHSSDTFCFASNLERELNSLKQLISGSENLSTGIDGKKGHAL